MTLSLSGAVEVSAQQPSRPVRFDDLIRLTPSVSHTGAVWQQVALAVTQTNPASNTALLELPGVGPVGAIDSTGRLGSTLSVLPDTFSVADVAVLGDMVFAAGTLDGQPRLALFKRAPETTYTSPRFLPLDSAPRSVAAVDIDFDLRVDVIVGESNNAIEIFSGSFLTQGTPSVFDRSDLAVLRLGGDPNVPADPITVLHGKLSTSGPVLSVGTGLLDADSFLDIAYATQQGASTVFASALLSSDNGYTTSPQIVASGTLPTGGATTDLIAVAPLNLADSGGIIDGVPDIALVRASGVELVRTVRNSDPLIDPTFAFGAVTGAGTNATGIAVLDVNSDSRLDLVVINSGSGNVTTNLASASGGYAAPTEVISGVDPVSLVDLDLGDGDTIRDLVIAQAGIAGTTKTFRGNGSGGFVFARSSSTTNATSVAVGPLDPQSQGDDLIIGSTGGVIHLSNRLAGLQAQALKRFTTASGAGTIDFIGLLNDMAIVDQFAAAVTASAHPDLAILENIDGLTGPPAVVPLRSYDFFPGVASSTAVARIDLPLSDFALGTLQPPGQSGRLIYFDNDGIGAFSNPTRFVQNFFGGSATHFVVGDLTNDFVEDVVILDASANTATVATTFGGPYFSFRSPVPTGGFVPVAGRLADVNDDDRLDLVVAHQGTLGVPGNQSVVTVLLGDGTGQLTLGSTTPVPNFALSIVGGMTNEQESGLTRIVDFNRDGFADFAVASTGGSLAGSVPSVTLLLNNATAPGTFTVSSPIPLIEDGPGAALLLVGASGGPGIVSGIGGDPSAPGKAVGGASTLLAVADFNADGRADLAACGTRKVDLDANGDGLGDAGTAVQGIPGVPAQTNLRAALYLLADSTTPGVFHASALRSLEFTPSVDSMLDFPDTFVASTVGRFADLANNVSDVTFVSLNGEVWVDINETQINNRAPVLQIDRSNLNAPQGQGRKHLVTAGSVSTVQTSAYDPNGNTLAFSLVPSPAGEQPPAFVSINQSGLITIDTTTFNPGSSPARFHIVAEATDNGTGALTGRDGFTLIVNPNTPPPVIGNVSPPSGTPGTEVTINGTGFVDGATVMFRGTAASSVTFVNPNQLRATVPNIAAGPAQITVTNPDLQFGTFNGFTVLAPPPVISSVSPLSATPGAQVNILGSQFIDGATVSFGGIRSPTVTYLGSTSLAAMVPLLPSGPVPVVVTNPDTQTATYNGFSVADTPACPRFTLVGTRAAGPDPNAIVTADFNRDGRRDVAVANRGANTVSLLLGNPDGTLGTATSFPVGSSPVAVAAGDLDDDGILDLAVPNSGSDNVSILRGTTGGGLGTAATYGVGSGPVGVAIADFDQDGKNDVVVANQTSGNVSFLRGVGDGTLMTAVNHSVGGNPVSLASADFNNDGMLDIAVAQTTSGKVTFLPGSSGGSFGTAVDHSIYHPVFVAAGDVNNDGKVDVAVASGLSAWGVMVLRGNGNFTFTTSYLIAGEEPMAVEIADMNRDGGLDLVVAGGTGNITVLTGSGSGAFATPFTLAGVAGRTAAIRGDDFNGDGKPDVALANLDTDSVAVLLNIGACPSNCGTFASAVNYPAGSEPNAIVIADFNRDGRRDLALANASSNSVSILIGNGTGGFATPVSFAAGTQPKGVATADFNRDAIPDLVVANSGSNNVSILAGDGSGSFGAATNHPAGSQPSYVTTGDFNRDGKADVAVANSASANVSILLGAGDGTFGSATPYGTGMAPVFAAAGDLDRDGDLDLFVANFNSNNVSILLGAGNGTFATAQNYPVGTGPRRIGAADFDGDGDADLAVTNEASNNVSLLRGAGDGTFGTTTNYAAGTTPSGVAAGDVNGDGRMDLALTNSTTDTVSILIGIGDGTFAAPSAIGVGDLPVAIVAGDFNADGKTDLAIANATAGTLSILLNSCQTANAAMNLQALAVSTSQANLTWSAVAGAVSYRLYRSSLNRPFVQIGTAVGTSYTDTMLAANTCYLYLVRPVDGTGATGQPSNIDLATTTVFTDDPLVARVTTIKVVHWVQARTAVNAVRAAAGLPQMAFTDSNLSGVVIKIVHLRELRQALDAARAAVGLSPLAYTDPNITVVIFVKIVHVHELRNGVK